MSTDKRRFQKALKRWYLSNARNLPWRSTHDPYRIWISEIMLQQTRVKAVIPYYERFLERFPDLHALAEAEESAVLAAWSGLGYYSRARNLQKAARQMREAGAFPSHYEGIRALAGIGDYTAAAVSSIAFGLAHAAVDGNVLRVVSRLYCDAGDIRNPAVKRRISALAEDLLDKKEPGLHNQAMMELGATICLPASPRCGECPLAAGCEANRLGRQHELPVKARRREMHRMRRGLLWIAHGGKVLARQRAATERKLAGFWELPEEGQVAGAVVGRMIGTFRHSITNHVYHYYVMEATIRRAPAGFLWLKAKDLNLLPASTTLMKALALVNSSYRKSLFQARSSKLN